MSKKEAKPKLIGPWRSIHGAIWLIGLAILAVNNWWWPGILVLIALSMLFEAILMQVKPEAFEKVETPEVSTSPSAGPETLPSFQPSPAPVNPEHRLDLLPSVCPKCGGPIRGHEVKWTSTQTADCPYCGAKLPMEKG
jgi:hypothetical protein